MSRQLEFPRESFRLVRIGRDDARRLSDDFHELRHLILQNEQAYPGIDRWFDGRVMEGLRNGQRTGFIGLLSERPVAAAIVKRGEKAKFCHLRIMEEERSRSLGDLFFVLMALEVRQRAREVHFTLPESVWEDRKGFFKSFTFDTAEKSGKQYRIFDTELFAATTFAQLDASVKAKLPKVFGHITIGQHSLLTGAVLALQPDPLSKILDGSKTVEIRTRFSKEWEGRRISLYGTRPISGLAGEARVARVITGDPNKIWETFGHAIGCQRSEYDQYVIGRDIVYAIVLDEVSAFSDPVPVSQLSHLLGVPLPAPQSYLNLSNNDGWLSAVALAAALQGSLTLRGAPKSLART